nr:flagellar hook-length control protein FliK [Lachnospiraceae bacterium]
MTSASIMEMQQTGYVSATNAVKAGAAAAEAQMQFSDAMQFASAGQQDESAGVAHGSEVKVHAEKNAAQHTGRKEIREAETVSSKEDVAAEKVSEEVEAEEEAIVKEIAEELGVSEEEVREAMEVLGLSVMDLLSQGNMVALAAELTGVQLVEVLTDETLFSQITDLAQTVQNQMQSLADELGMSVEELQAVIDKQMSMQNVEESVSMDRQQMQMVDEASQVAEEPVMQEAEVIAEEPTESKDAATVKVTEEDGTSESETVADAQQTTKHENSAMDKGEDKNSALMNGQNTQTVVNGEVNYVNQASADEIFEGQFDLERTREMIDQISDYVRLHHSEKISSMEIQLHPVELGTVNLQVVAKDGTISAQLTVQDEAIRAALEGQMLQLRESLQEQGLKIDAVEVTVASHEFEQNLDQHGKDAEDEAAREKKSSRRILNLDEIGQEELEEMEMSDADRLQIEMMRMGGNRMNFRV